MNNEVLLMVAKSGVFAVLFVILLAYAHKYTRTLDQHYPNIINTMSKELSCVFSMGEDIKQIKTAVIAKPLYYVEENI